MDIDSFKATYSDKIGAAVRQLHSQARLALPMSFVSGAPKGADSRFGGSVLWPDQAALPSDESGQTMTLVLQINLEQFESLEGFPTRGLLQLFIANDLEDRSITFLREYRRPSDFPLQNGDGFRLVYHSDPATLVDSEVMSTVASHEIITAAVSRQFPPMTHWVGSEIAETIENLPEAEDLQMAINDLLFDEVWDDQPPAALYLGGFACPLQQDHRAHFEEYQCYD